jgi:hypothetical protein
VWRVLVGLDSCPGCRLWWWRGWAALWPWERAAPRCVDKGEHVYPHPDSLAAR